MSLTFPTGGIVPSYEEGPVTFQVSAAVAAGLLVESDGGSPAMCRPASAGSELCIGVATLDAVPTTTSQTPTVPGWPGPSINAALLPPYTSVAARGVWLLQYAASCAFGDRVKCAAAGQVTPWIFGTDNPELIVGICYEPAGVTFSSPGTLGQTRLCGLGS